MNLLDFPAWKNGNFCTVKDLSISILDLGLIHCDATYDVLAVKNGGAQNLDMHLKRFYESANGWRIPVHYSKQELSSIIDLLIKKSDTNNLLVWIGLTRGIPSSGNPRDLVSCDPNIFIYTKPYYGFNESNSATVCLANSVYRVPNNAINQIHKNFAWNDLTKAQWEAIDKGFDTAILTTEQGYVTEGPGFNVGIIMNDTILAPMSNRLQGTIMETIRQKCKLNQVEFEYQDFKVDDILAADSMFLTSTAGNVIQVTKFENKTFSENTILQWLMNSI